MPFKSAYLKLTVYYVIILMAISIGFSVAIYRISATEINKSLGQQNRILQDLYQDSNPFFQSLEDARNQQIEESNNRIKTNLYYFNLLILLLSTIGSYFFARSTLKPVEESYEAQARFTADASHELRTPLTAMKTEIEVLLRKRQITKEEAKQLLVSNLEEIDKLEALSASLLKLAKLDTEQTNVFRSISIPDVIAEAYERVAILADQKEIEFENNIESVHIAGHKDSLVEVMTILLDNAVKYSLPKGKIKIRALASDHHLKITVKDYGIGIKASDLPHIFNRFFRADHSRNKEKISGYGLGLSIAKRIIDLHKGKISVVSTPGKGSEFTIKLPKD